MSSKAREMAKTKAQGGRRGSTKGASDRRRKREEKKKRKKTCLTSILRMLGCGRKELIELGGTAEQACDILGCEYQGGAMHVR